MQQQSTPGNCDCFVDLNIIIIGMEWMEGNPSLLICVQMGQILFLCTNYIVWSSARRYFFVSFLSPVHCLTYRCHTARVPPKSRCHVDSSASPARIRRLLFDMCAMWPIAGLNGREGDGN